MQDGNLYIFQFTTSQGGRQCHQDYRQNRRIFQFTTSQGGRRRRMQKKRYRMPFNSRPHKEVDPSPNRSWSNPTSFNSRPHKEVDLPHCNALPGRDVLSIHDLTRRSTFIPLEISYPQNLSIHDLTRRSTILTS